MATLYDSSAYRCLLLQRTRRFVHLEPQRWYESCHRLLARPHWCPSPEWACYGCDCRCDLHDRQTEWKWEWDRQAELLTQQSDSLSDKYFTVASRKVCVVCTVHNSHSNHKNRLTEISSELYFTDNTTFENRSSGLMCLVMLRVCKSRVMYRVDRSHLPPRCTALRH